MKYLWVFVIGVPLLIIATYMSIKNKKKVLEKFGVFGTYAIPYNKLIKELYTEKELIGVRADWERKNVDEKNREIHSWNRAPPELQEAVVKMVKGWKDSRQRMETI